MATVANRIGDADPLELLALANLDGSIPAISAAKWTTPRTLSFTGNVTGSGSVDGSANVATALTIGAGQVTEAMQVLANNTTNNVSTSKHGYAPILPNDATKYLDGTGNYSVPAGGGGSGTVTSVSLSGPFGGGTVTTSGTLGTSSITAHGVLIGAGSSALAVTSAGTAGQALISGGASADPAFTGIGWVLISEQTPSGTGTVTFSSFPSTYRDLRVVTRGAGSKSATFVAVRIQFNGDTNANYDYQSMTANNTSNSNVGNPATTFIETAFIPAATGVSNASSVVDMIVYNYRDTTFHKSTISTGGIRISGAASGLFVNETWGDWRSTSAITSVTVFLESGNFVSGSVVSLYGSY